MDIAQCYFYTDTIYEFKNLLVNDEFKMIVINSWQYLTENKLVEISKEMLENSTNSINEIARTLDYDPSNFTKFFKRFVGLTPTQYRKSKTEYFTI